MLEAHPGSIVVTVCAGRPSPNAALTEWDRAAGFQAGDDVMGVRRKEDERALTLLSAHPLWLDFCDRQYRPSPSPESVMEALHQVVLGGHVTTIVLPLGLFHSDHVLTHDATLLLRRRHPRLPGLAEARLNACASAGLTLQPAAFPVNPLTNRKQAAVECYQSQLRALSTPGRPGYVDTVSEETFWRIAS
jgi:LmbE family N-acetylglucosaminyl deacetylase